MSLDTLERVDLDELVNQDLQCGIPNCDKDATWVGKHLCCGAATKPACDHHKRVVDRNFTWFTFQCLLCGCGPMGCSWVRL